MLNLKWVVAVVLGVAVIVIGYDTYITAQNKEKPKAPEFTRVTEWVNSKELKMADLRDKVVIVHFWTHGCINCIHNYPQYQSWQEKYKDNKDVVMIGIHTPEFDSEKKIDNIKKAAEKNKLKFAIAVDNDWANWKAWGNRYWPCVYLVDKKGIVRTYWEGELQEKGYKHMTAILDELIAETDKKK